jgi:hypothetical protein
MKRLLTTFVVLLLAVPCAAQISSSSIGRTLGSYTAGSNLYVPENTPSSAPTGALAGDGAGNVEDGTHTYVVTFVTSSGETTPSAPSNVVTVADKTADGKVALTGIPIGTSSVTARKLYRTFAGGTAHFLLTTLANNTATTYTDNTADASLTTAAPTQNTTSDMRYTFGQNGPTFGSWMSIYDTGSGVRLTANSQVYQFVQTYPKSLTESSATGFVRIDATQEVSVTGSIFWEVQAYQLSGTKSQALTGQTRFAIVNKGGTETCAVNQAGTDLLAESEAGSTLACTFTCASNVADTVDILANCASSLTQNYLQIRWQMLGQYTLTVTPL